MKNFYLPVNVQKKNSVIAVAILLLSVLFFAPAAGASAGNRVKKHGQTAASSLGAPTISYTSPQTYYVGHTIASLTPTSSGVAGLTYKSPSVTMGGSYSAMCAPAFDAAGNMYLAAQSKTAVNEVPADGSAVVTIASGFTNVNCLAFDQHGNLYVSDAGSGFSTPGGVFEITAGSHALITIKNNMLTPGSLAIDAAGNIFVGQSTGTGLLEIKTNATTANIGTGFYSVGGLAIDASGYLYIADGNSPWIWRVSPDYSTFTKYAFGNGEDWENPTGLAIDAGGNLFVGDQGTHLVQLIPPGGNTAIVIGAIGTPFGMSMDGKGVVYLADNTQSAIFEIVPVGGYHLNKQLPSGLSFDDATGIISGTPTAITPATDYQVTAYNGSGGTTTTVNIATLPVTASLIALTTSAGTLSPAFDAATISYTAQVSNGTTSVTVTPTANLHSTITVNGAAVTSGSVSASIPLAVGSNAVTIVVTSIFGTVTRTYTVNVTRAASSEAHLLNLVVNPAPFTQAFNPNVYNYESDVPESLQYVTFKATLMDTTATIAEDGHPMANNITTTPMALLSGTTMFTFRVTAQDGVTSQLYFVNITRVASSEAHLLTLAVNPAPFTQAFNSNVYNYESDVVESLQSVTFKATLVDTTATLSEDGHPMVNNTTTAPVALLSGSTMFAIRATAQDGVTFQQYQVVVNRGRVATLSNLLNSTGPVSPAFDPSITNYTTNIPYSSQVTDVVPTSTDPDATITVNGIQVRSGTDDAGDLTMNVGANTISIVVTSYDKAATKTYTLTVYRGNTATLSNLSLSNTSISPAFAPATTSYSASVGNLVRSKTITVTPTLTDPAASVTVNGTAVASGTASNPIYLNVGANTISVAVTSADGSATQAYTITVTRAPSIDANLASINLGTGPLSPVFDPNTTIYTISVKNTVASITVKAITDDANATIKLNGTALASGTISQPIVLAEGATTAITITVTAENTASKQTYTIKVSRAASANANLAAIVPGVGMLAPAFSSANPGYTLNVSYATATITIKPVSSDANATITVNGTGVLSRNPSGAIALSVGSNTIPIIVTAQDGVTTNTYTITVTRASSSDASLSNLAISPGTLKPVFNAATTAYAVAVGNGVTSVMVTPTTNDPGATVTVNGVTVTSGTASAPINLVVGANTITTVITAQNGVTTKNYKITITRALSTNAKLISLKLSTGTLSPAFSNSITSYNSTVPYTVKSITIKPTAAVTVATITVNGVAVNSGSDSGVIDLSVGNNTITTVVTAQDGLTTSSYTLTVTRVAPSNVDYLDNVTISQGSLSPVFSTATTAYTDIVTSGTVSVRLTPFATATTAIITVNGVAVASGSPSAPIALRIGSNNIAIVVTAQDGTTTQTYIVNVIRPSTNASLLKLTTSHGGLTPAFSHTTYSYSQTLTTAVSLINFTPTAQDPTATITVNGVPTASGTASANLPLNVGANVFPIVVTAQDGQTKLTYTVTVTQTSTGLNTVYEPVSVEKPIETPIINEDRINVHQGVSPNGDGINDFLIIENIANYPDNKLHIMNRSGQLVFEAKGYDNSSGVFDGHSNKNGQMQLPGTYFYQLDYTVNGIAKQKTGFIILKY